MIYLTIAIVVVFLSDLLIKQLQLLRQKIRRKKNFNFFQHEYIESKGFYAYLFNRVPVVSYINDVDSGEAYTYIRDNMEVANIYQHLTYNRKMERQEFNRTFFELKNGMLVELGTNYAELLCAPGLQDQANGLVTKIAQMKAKEKKQDAELNIIMQTSYGLELKAIPITETDLDISLYYNDDFKPVDILIRERLSQSLDKGIVLLHGLPGTGKTTYLRYLIGQLNKKVLFMSPAVAANLTNPEFIELLLDNPNSILVIEDAENIIMDRKFSQNSSVANLLNIGDGLLSDCLSVQIICTFNNALASVDTALMRKGRLIARYEFSKLGINKAQALSNHLGFNRLVNEPMTLAEIANPGQNDESIQTAGTIGFKQHVLATN